MKVKINMYQSSGHQLEAELKDDVTNQLLTPRLKRGPFNELIFPLLVHEQLCLVKIVIYTNKPHNPTY